MSKGISGLGIALATAGGVVVWSGLNNAGILDTLRALAKGQAPPKNPNKAFELVQLNTDGGTGLGAIATAANSARGASIVAVAQKHLHQHPYRYGAGHGAWNCSSGVPQDCSGFASCVLHELGLLSHPLNTTGFIAWSGATTVPWDQRQAGDLIIWPGHMGIAVSVNQMIHTGGAPGCPCEVAYTQMRSGRKGIARRVK
jgi:cell wall-associated NlpC family hydrolase